MTAYFPILDYYVFLLCDFALQSIRWRISAQLVESASIIKSLHGSQYDVEPSVASRRVSTRRDACVHVGAVHK